MKRQSDFKAEQVTTTFSKFLGAISLTAFAEEDPNSEPNSNPDPKNQEGGKPSIDFEQMIAQARKEEKEKLYPRLKKLEDENKTLKNSVNTYLLENATLKDEIEKLSKTGESSEVQNLKDQVKTLTEEKEALTKDAPNEEEIRAKIEKEFEVKMYIKDKLAENKESILSIFTSEVTGTTKEEVDEALRKAMEKTESVKKDLGLDEKKDSTSQDPTPSTPSKPKKVPPASPPQVDNKETFDAEYVRNMDPRSEEYKEFRKKMGLK